MALPPELYTEAEVAKMLQVAEVTLRKWRGAGRIGYTQIGSSIRYTNEQVLDFISRGGHPPLCDHCKEPVHATA